MRNGLTAVPVPIRVFVSSRIQSPISYRGKTVTLAELRADVHALIKAEKLFGYEIFDPWISEATAEDAGETAISRCIRYAADSHIFLAITNGEAGFVVGASDNGICHEELAAAYNRSPDKVYVIQLSMASPAPKSAANTRFQKYLADIGSWENPARNGEEVLTLVRGALTNAVVKLTTGTVPAGRTGARMSIDSLSWESLDLRGRAAAIEKETIDFLKGCELKLDAPDEDVYLRFGSIDTFCRIAAVPEALSRDPTSTRTSLAKCFAWLKRGAQLENVGARARRRKILVSAMQTVSDDMLRPLTGKQTRSPARSNRTNRT